MSRYTPFLSFAPIYNTSMLKVNECHLYRGGSNLWCYLRRALVDQSTFCPPVERATTLSNTRVSCVSKGLLRVSDIFRINWCVIFRDSYLMRGRTLFVCVLSQDDIPLWSKTSANIRNGGNTVGVGEYSCKWLLCRCSKSIKIH